MPILELPKIADDAEIDEFLKRVAENIKRIRLEKGVSQLDLSLTIGIKSPAFIACVENGMNKKRFNIIHLYKIAKALDVDVGRFFE